MTGHARLSASSSKRWLTCSASVLAIEQDKANGIIPTEEPRHPAAELGTAAHELLELCVSPIAEFLGEPLNPFDFLQKEFNGFEVNEEMATAVNIATNYIDQQVSDDSVFKSEQYYPITEDCGGTSDIVINDEDVLHIIDYKHGEAVYVDVEDNTQLLIYAYGVLQNTDWSGEPVKMTIIQPRCGDQPIRSTEITREELEFWGACTLLPTVENITSNTNTVFKASQEGCMWCPRKAYCRTRKDYFSEMGVEGELKPVNAMSDEELLHLWQNTDDIRSWLVDISKHMHQRAIQGHAIKGTKLIERKSNRKYKDEENLNNKLTKLGLRDFHEPSSIKSPAQVEKLIKEANLLGGKELRQFMEEITTREVKQPKLVTVETNGKEVNPTIEDDFKDL